MTNLVLGFLLAVAFVTQDRLTPRPPMGRKKELIDRVKQLEKERHQLKGQLKEIRLQTTELEKKAASAHGVLGSFTGEIDEIELAVGLKKVKGPGVTVLLADSPSVPSGRNPADFVIHDYDLRVIVNALWSGGAEAVSVNGQRLIFCSDLCCVGTTVMVNSVRKASPYEIKAIGDKESLERAVMDNSDAAELITSGPRIFGLVIVIEKEKELVIPAYSGSYRVDYSRSLGE